jgi:serine protease Do
VFAISCKTGEFELVGVYHAGYTRGSALNVVVGIDQVRDLMTTLKRVPRPRTEANAALDGASRAQLLAASRMTLEPFFAFGPVTAAVRPREDGSLLYEVLNRDFPFRGYAVLVLEDLPTADAAAFGTPGRVWIGNRQGLKAYVRSDLDVDTQAQLARLLEGLRRESVVAFAVRTADRDASSSKEKFQRTERLEKALQRSSASYTELAQSTGDLADRFGPSPGEPTVTLEATLVATPKSADATAGPPAPVSALTNVSGMPSAGAVQDTPTSKQSQSAPSVPTGSQN